MEEGSWHPGSGTIRKEQDSTTINDMHGLKEDKNMHYIFHCGIAVGAIYSGSEEQCRKHILNNPSLMSNSLILTEKEYNTFKNKSENHIRVAFKQLTTVARTRFPSIINLSD